MKMKNRKAAIEWFSVLKKKFVKTEYEGYLDMAISALEKQEADNSCTPPSDDWEHYEDRLYDIAYQNGYERGKKDAEQDRWIPITERMPEENDIVLVTVSGEEVLGLRRRDWKDSMALAVWTNQWNLVDANLVSYRISAWRPLPELYTEDEA